MFMGRAPNNHHMCKQCSRSFKDINNYKEHCFQEHQIQGSQKVHKCGMCSYATLLKSKYDCHMRCHLNNEVVKCKYCDYSTINIRHMSRHERNHIMTNNIISQNSDKLEINKRKLLVQSNVSLMDSVENESRMKKAKVIKHDFQNGTFSGGTSIINPDELEIKKNDANHFNQSNGIGINSCCFESSCVHKLQFEVLQKKFFKMLLLLVPQISTHLTTNSGSNILDDSALNFTQTNEIIDYLTRFFEMNITSDNFRA